MTARRRWFKNILPVVLCGILAGCMSPETTAPRGSAAEIEKERRVQMEMTFSTQLEEERRVFSIAYPVFKANVDLCPVYGYAMGLYVWNKYHFDRKDRHIAKNLFALGETLQVKHVMPGSPAERAGIHIGDRIISMNGKDVSKGVYASRNFNRAVNKVYDHESIDFVIQRGTSQFPVTVTREKICGFGMIYNADKAEVNAYADGNNVYLTRGYYKFAENDEEIAEVIGHELAHNAMMHSAKKVWNSIIPVVAGIAINVGNIANGTNFDADGAYDMVEYTRLIYSPSFEREADYVGMYMAARAGFDTSKSAHAWRRMSAEHNGHGIDVELLNSHPSNPDRFVSMEKTHREIAHKKRRGLPLIPNMEEGKTLPLINPPAIRKGGMR